MSRQDREQEHIEEARRLRKLPRQQQREILALHLSVADDPKVSPANRRLARERFQALSRLLRLTPKFRKNP
jgi:hypothetical protein